MRHVEITAEAGAVHLDRIPTGWSLDLVVPAAQAAEAGAVLAEGLRAIAADGGGLARLWVRAGDPATMAAARELGFEHERALHQLRRPLPVDEPSTLVTRPFVVGQDEDAWLEVNNRAFSWHPEQGGWTRDDLEARFGEPWFDPAGFLLHEQDGRLVGFCWTKEHRDTDPPMGEIYVIAVDPAAGRTGLGRPLTLAGLDHLHRRGLDVGMLYVDGGNEAGMALYERLGFSIHHTDEAWTVEVAAR